MPEEGASFPHFSHSSDTHFVLTLSMPQGRGELLPPGPSAKLSLPSLLTRDLQELATPSTSEGEIEWGTRQIAYERM